MTTPDRQLHEIIYKGLWDSCVDLAAQLPGGLFVKRIHATWLPRWRFPELPGNYSNLLEIVADVHWLGETSSNGDVHFDGRTILDRRESTPDGAISDVENAILCSMGDPHTESFPAGFIIEDYAPRKSAHPALARNLAVTCLRWAGDEMFSVRTIAEEGRTHEEFARATSWTNLGTGQSSKAVFAETLELMNIRRHLALAAGIDTVAYDTDYLAARKAYDGLCALSDKLGLDIPIIRE